MKIARREFCWLVLSGLLSFFSACSSSIGLKLISKKKIRRFVFCTDLHAVEQWRVPEALSAAARQINEENPEFVICGGDLISEGLSVVSDIADRRWSVFRKFQAELKSDFFAVPGNHDLSKASDAKNLDETSFQFAARREFLANTSSEKSFQILEYGNLVIVMLDSLKVLREPVLHQGLENFYRGHISSSQLEWLEVELQRFSSRTEFIVVSHIPFVSNYYQEAYPQGQLSPTQYVENYQKVLDLFSDKKLIAVLQGHTHVNEIIRDGGISFITSGAICGDWWCGEKEGSGEGFLVVELEEGVIRVQFKEYDWHTYRNC